MKLQEIIQLPNYYQDMHRVPGIKMINIVDVDDLQHRARLKCFTHDRTQVYVEFKADNKTPNLINACIRHGAFSSRKSKLGIITFLQYNLDKLVLVAIGKESVKSIESSLVSIEKKNAPKSPKYKLNWNDKCSKK